MLHSSAVTLRCSSYGGSSTDGSGFPRTMDALDSRTRQASPKSIASRRCLMHMHVALAISSAVIASVSCRLRPLDPVSLSILDHLRGIVALFCHGTATGRCFCHLRDIGPTTVSIVFALLVPCQYRGGGGCLPYGLAATYQHYYRKSSRLLG